MPKLFEITYLDDCEWGSYLTVSEDKYEVEKRERQHLMDELSCFMTCFADEVVEVDGYKIKLEK